MQMDKLHRWCGMLRKRTLVWGRAEAHSSRNIFLCEFEDIWVLVCIRLCQWQPSTYVHLLPCEQPHADQPGSRS